MSPLDNITHTEVVEQHRPWPRANVTNDGWHQSIAALAEGRCTLLGLWADAPDVHMALLDESSGKLAVVTCVAKSGNYPSVASRHPAANRLERAIRDLSGLEAIGTSDARPWLDLGFWAIRHPLGKKMPARRQEPYTFLPAVGEALHQIPVGPVHAGIIEPGHFRFSANGEHVVRLEQRLGWVHKGIESLMAGSVLEDAAKLAARTSGDSTVAISFAFAQAAEAALQMKIPPRAAYLRALMAELERLANHFGDIGAICNDASFSLMHAQCGILRERTLRAAGASFGHRLMMDAIVPGGVAQDLAPEGVAQIRALIGEVRRVFPRLIELYDNFARQFGAGGYVGRASGRAFDARRAIAYAPYDRLTFDVPVLETGDVNARVWIRIREVDQSLSLIEQILDNLPNGAILTTIGKSKACEGIALVEAFRGDVMVWLRLDGRGRVARCHIRDASWFQWPLLEAAIEGNIVADFPICNKSFNCSYSGHDL